MSHALQIHHTQVAVRCVNYFLPGVFGRRFGTPACACATAAAGKRTRGARSLRVSVHSQERGTVVREAMTAEWAQRLSSRRCAYNSGGARRAENVS
jgi:hypothetical protein